MTIIEKIIYGDLILNAVLIGSGYGALPLKRTQLSN